MTSAFVDATVCLLLVSASVATLVDVPGRTPPPPPPEGTAAVVATATATAEYESAAGDRRTVHGSLAELLAAAVVAERAGSRGGPGTLEANSLVPAVLAAVGEALPVRSRVVARLESGDDQTVVAVGPEPPAGARVDAARFRVPAPDSATGDDDGGGADDRPRRVHIVARWW